MSRVALFYVAVVTAACTLLVFCAADDQRTAAAAPVSPFSDEASAYGSDAVAEADTGGLDAPQRVRPPRIKPSYSFAGEEVPIADFDVRDRLNRELVTNTFYHSSTQWILKYKSRYFPVIEEILREEGVPDDLKYIAVAESALRDFRSPAGAAGVWHFMPATAREYGLEVNGEVDERYDLEASTRAAAQFLEHLHGRLGSWTLAAAAYNRGLGGIRSRKESQRAEEFWDLYLNEETSRYVLRVVALKDIIEDPTYYGFYLGPEDYEAPVTDFATVTVTESISDLPAFAERYGMSYRRLKVLNPWLRDTELTISTGNSYEIRVGR